MQLLFKAVALALQILHGLSILRLTAGLGLCKHCRQLLLLYLCQFFTACKNVHGQLLIISQIDVIHLIQHVDILHQNDLVVLQSVYDLVHIGLGLIVFCLKVCQLIALFFEEAE